MNNIFHFPTTGSKQQPHYYITATIIIRIKIRRSTLFEQVISEHHVGNLVITLSKF